MNNTVVTTGMEALGTVVTWLTTQFSNIIEVIIATPILLLPVGIFVAGAIIGLAHRLIRG